jgi:DNA adenine methylase
MPEHRLYCEPFLGVAAIFFAKEPSTVEIVNDTNGELINFYQAVKRDFAALEQEVSLSLHSRKQHNHARVIYKNPDLFNPVKRAWAIWVLANTSYGCKLDGSFAHDRNGCASKKLNNKRMELTALYAERLRRVQIECCDAIRIITSRDVPDGFFYLDPPYVGADQGHYDGYTQEDFDALLSTLESLKGKFILSSYRNRGLTDYTCRNGWYTLEFRMRCSMTNRYESKDKIEVMTANYPIDRDMIKDIKDSESGE